MNAVEKFVEHRSLVDRFVHKYGRLPTEFDPDYLEMLRMTKYRILDVPDLKPGKCANCGASKNDGRKYIDFGLEIDWHGIVYICGLCLNDIAVSFGLFDEMQKKLKEAQHKALDIEELQHEGVELRDTVLQTFEEVKSYFDNLHAIGNDSSSNPTTVVGTNETESDNKRVVGSDTETAKSHQRTTKSSTGSRSTDVPSLAKLLNAD